MTQYKDQEERAYKAHGTDESYGNTARAARHRELAFGPRCCRVRLEARASECKLQDLLSITRKSHPQVEWMVERGRLSSQRASGLWLWMVGLHAASGDL